MTNHCQVYLYVYLLSWLSSRRHFYPLLSSSTSSSLHQIELLQVVSEDGVFDGHEDEADVFRVRGAGEVRVQRLVLFRVLFLVHFQDEFLSCSGILLRSCKSRSLFQYAECNFCTHAVVLIKTCKHPGKSY